MSWATQAISTLQTGKEVQIRPRGHSMKGKVNDGELVTLSPIDASSLIVGDIVLVRVKGSVYLHLVKAIDGDRFQIGNNRGGINGWVSGNSIFGKAIRIEN
jgi:hypothetical protein